MGEAIEFELKYSQFIVAKNVLFKQSQGLIIGSVDGGDVSDTVYALDEALARVVIEAFALMWERYRNNIFMLVWDADNTLTEDAVRQQLRAMSARRWSTT